MTWQTICLGTISNESWHITKQAAFNFPGSNMNKILLLCKFVVSNVSWEYNFYDLNRDKVPKYVYLISAILWKMNKQPIN